MSSRSEAQIDFLEVPTTMDNTHSRGVKFWMLFYFLTRAKVIDIDSERQHSDRNEPHFLEPGKRRRIERYYLVEAAWELCS